MRRPRMKDEFIAFLVFLASILMGSNGDLYISQKSATKLVNETFFVLCRDTGGNPVSWKGPKGILGPRTRPSVAIATYGSKLIFNKTTFEDSGTYTCKSVKEHQEFRLNIEAPLAFVDTNMEQTGAENSDVFLRCEVREGKVTWSVEGGGADIADTGKFVAMGDGLLIKNVSRSDSKTYVCKAIQEKTGMLGERKIKLKVLHQPVFPHQSYAKQEIVYGYINGTVNLTCMAIANPQATFEWMKSSDRKRKSIGEIINEAQDISILRLHVTGATFGNYKCIAKNPHGTLEKHFSLQEGAKPHPPKYIELKGANSNLLDLGIYGSEKDEVVIEPGMEPTGYHIQFKKINRDGWEIRDYNISEENRYVLDELNPETKYEVKVATRNAAGLSEFTNTSIFETLESDKGYSIQASLPSTVIVMFLTGLSLAFW